MLKLSNLKLFSALRQAQGHCPSDNGGEAGIRTRGTSRYNGFRDRPVKPLRHLSEKLFSNLKLIIINK
jgi:hypothetical protein